MEKFKSVIEQLKENDSYRKLLNIDEKGKKHVSVDGHKMLNLSSNDYLGLSTDKELLFKFYDQLNDDNVLEQFGLGATSSRLLTGNNNLYTQLENKLATLYGKEAALIFNSGYHANLGILPAILGGNDLILSDKMNHASIIDGIKLTGNEFVRYHHLDYEHLEFVLKRKRKNFNRVVIVSESIFSMDGDIADMKKLIELKNKYNALLYIDEAHALGAVGENGLGECERQGVIDDVDIIVGTFGKAFASQGAFAVLNNVLKEVLVNKMRPLIFTTALPPVILNWISFIIDHLKTFAAKRRKLEVNAKAFHELLIKNNIKSCGHSYIIPVIVGDNDATLALAEELKAKGFMALAVRPPTVPPNSSRLRISLTSNIDWEDIESLPTLIKQHLNAEILAN